MGLADLTCVCERAIYFQVTTHVSSDRRGDTHGGCRMDIYIRKQTIYIYDTIMTHDHDCRMRSNLMRHATRPMCVRVTVVWLSYEPHRSSGS
jgi:hypothetical protein